MKGRGCDQKMRQNQPKRYPMEGEPLFVVFFAAAGAIVND